ncbi:hypothetical protein [Pseudokordiimonas caeni]|uniref:hypothetical protein n=1 Tax=Pseudokordiimonas caeni TaxID=2997908 RepID=UPI0028109E09|nr:hypothetical protein [Pseudokordiimonas caeni]
MSVPNSGSNLDAKWELSDHAAQRSAERFSGIDPLSLLREAKIARKSQLARIKRDCPNAAKHYMRGFNGRYFMVSQNRYVFIVEPPKTVITCWDWHQYKTLDLKDLDRLERRKPKNGNIHLNESEFFGLLNLARRSFCDRQ